jgi:hypothetical protein
VVPPTPPAQSQSQHAPPQSLEAPGTSQENVSKESYEDQRGNVVTTTTTVSILTVRMKTRELFSNPTILLRPPPLRRQRQAPGAQRLCKLQTMRPTVNLLNRASRTHPARAPHHQLQLSLILPTKPVQVHSTKPHRSQTLPHLFQIEATYGIG